MNNTYNFLRSDLMSLRVIARDLCGEETGNWNPSDRVLEDDSWIEKAEIILDEMREE